MNQATVKAKILIIEDDASLNTQLAELLSAAGYQVSQSYDGEDGLLTALQTYFDLILLDVSLPQQDGYALLKTLRRSRTVPVMMLTAHAAEEERIIGLRNGADDYLSKPFNLTELLLRIEAVLRRSHPRAENRKDQTILRHREIALDKNTQRAWFDGRELDFTAIQFKLFWVLTENNSQTLSKPLLYRLVLQREFSRYDRSLDMHMSRVRRKLTAAGMASDKLQTVHGTGYLLL